MWEKEEIEALEQDVGRIAKALKDDINRQPSDEIVEGLSYEELSEAFKKVGNYIDSELFFLG